MNHLIFRLASARWALPADQVGAIGDDRPVRSIPRLAGAVRGLSTWRGAVVTVIDLAAFVGEGPGEGGPTFVRLAPPYDHTALWIPARVALSSAPLEDGVRTLDTAHVLSGAGVP